jgi:hypothetical protein
VEKERNGKNATEREVKKKDLPGKQPNTTELITAEVFMASHK